MTFIKRSGQMKHKVSTVWKGDTLFDSEIEGHHILAEAPGTSGEEREGVPPKKLMLTALAGCTGIDVVAMLRKMRVEIDDFRIHIEAELTDELPKHYSSMHVVYEFSGKDLPLDKLERAVELSKEKYCGVSHVYRQAMEMTHEVRVQGV